MYLSPSKAEGAGKPGARCTRGLVCNCAQETHTSIQASSGDIPAFPARWFTAYFVLSPVTGLSCHRRLAEYLPQSLAPASGRQDHDFAVRVGRARQSQAIASTASHRTFVTIASRPSCRVRRAES